MEIVSDSKNKMKRPVYLSQTVPSLDIVAEKETTKSLEVQSLLRLGIGVHDYPVSWEVVDSNRPVVDVPYIQM